MIKEGENIGYNVNRSQRRLIVKDEETKVIAQKEFGTLVNIPPEGQRHLGAVIGSTDFKEIY